MWTKARVLGHAMAGSKSVPEVLDQSVFFFDQYTEMPIGDVGLAVGAEVPQSSRGEEGVKRARW